LQRVRRKNGLQFKYGSGFSEKVAAPLRFPDSVLLCAFLLSPRKLWGWYLLVGIPIHLLHATVPVWLLAATYLNDGLTPIHNKKQSAKQALMINLDNPQNLSISA